MSQRKQRSRLESAGAGSPVRQNFERIARKYLGDLQLSYQQSVSSDQTTPELSYRPVLDKFLRDLASLFHPEIECIFEPRKQAKSGRPDWRFHHSKTLGLYGYVEAKALDTNTSIKIANYKKQISRYLELGAKVVVTDGVEFVFLSSTAARKKILLAPKPLTGSDWSDLMPNPRIESHFRDFFSSTVSQPTSEESLVRELAKRAVEMSRGVRELAGLTVGQGTTAEENATIGALYELQTVLQEHHDPSLKTPKVFGDFVAQVLAFGLLYAHRVVGATEDTPPQRREKILRFWRTASFEAFKQQLDPFRAIVGLLAAELESSGPLGTWYQDSLKFLSHVRLENFQTTTPDYHILYQTFLDAFDSQTKFDFGTYYTPVELSGFTVRLVSALVKSEIEGRELFEAGNKLIDPCCGTGTFLEQLINLAPKKQLPEIIGFEILPAPYALSHYRLSLLPIAQSLRGNISVVLTNTLSDEIAKKVNADFEPNLFKQEQDRARTLARPPVTLVIGNPPSSDSYEHADGEHFEIINRLIDDFRPPRNRRTARQNIQKQLKNPFVKFVRWTCEKLADRHPGIFALVLPSSFLSHETYRYARRWIVGRFRKVWVLDLDDDLRRGFESSSIFNTQQGRALVIGMTASPNDKITGKATLHYATIKSLSRSQKIAELELERSEENLLGMFRSFDLDETTYNLKPSRRLTNASYESFWPLYPPKTYSMDARSSIFQRVCSGIKLAPTSLFVHAEQGLLLRRSRDIADLTNSVDALLTKWFTGQTKRPKKEKLTLTVRTKIGDDLKDTNAVRRYSYRPFLNPHVLLAKEALASLRSMPRSGTRPRPEVVAAFSDSATVGISVAPAPEDIGEGLHRFVSFCWYFPDNDLCARGNAKVFCNQFPEYKSGKWNPKPELNINVELLNQIMAMTRMSEKEAAAALVYYTFAVMCSTEYLTEFADELFRTADSEKPPRVPITRDAKLFEAIFRRGQALAALEKPQDGSSLHSFSALVKLFPGPFRLTNTRIKSETGEIDFFQNGELKLNLKPIPRSILDFQVGGYQVLQQWLKLYTYPFLRADFNELHCRQFLELLSQIEKQMDIVKELSPLVSQMLDDKAELLPRPES